MSVPGVSLLLPLTFFGSPVSEGSAPVGPERPTVLVLEVKRSEEVSVSVGARFSNALSEGLTSSGARLTSVEAVTDPAQVASCGDDSACFTRLLGEQGQVLSFSLGRVGQAWIGSATLLDLSTSRVAARAGGSDTDPEQLGRAMARQLTGDEASAPVQARIEVPDEPRFVLLDVEAAGLPEGSVGNLDQVIAKELQRIDGASVMSREEVEVLLGVEQLRRVLDKDCDKTCFNRIAGALDADYVVTGRIGQLDGTFVVQVNAIEQRGDLQAYRRSEIYQGQADELIGATRHATQSLFGTAQGTGALTVSASPEGARLSVDDDEMGQLPLPPAAGLLPGRHTVVLEKDGFLPYRTDVYVNPDDTSVLWAELERAPERWYEKWWVWTLVGVAVAGATTAVTVAVTDQAPDTSALSVEFR